MTTAHAPHAHQPVIRYTPTTALLADAWTTYTYWPALGDPRPRLAPGTTVEIIANDRDFRPGTRALVTILNPVTGVRYRSVPASDLFVHHRGC